MTASTACIALGSRYKMVVYNICTEFCNVDKNCTSVFIHFDWKRLQTVIHGRLMFA